MKRDRHSHAVTSQYDTIEELNVELKAECGQLNVARV